MRIRVRGGECDYWLRSQPAPIAMWTEGKRLRSRTVDSISECPSQSSPPAAASSDTSPRPRRAPVRTIMQLTTRIEIVAFYSHPTDYFAAFPGPPTG